MKVIQRFGLTVPSGPKPSGPISTAPNIFRIALFAPDYPSVRVEMLVEEGSLVATGQPVMRDRKRSEIVFAAPSSGRVVQIVIGARRRVQSVVIAPEGNEVRTFDVSGSATPEGLRRLLLETGLWLALRARPFERVPSPDASASAIFITAIDTNPDAPDPLDILKDHEEQFERGVRAIEMLTDGPLFLCQAPGQPLLNGNGRTTTATVQGHHPAGLVGTHIARLFPARLERPVWHIGYQDVIALGHLLGTGTLETTRVVSVGGPGVRNPRYIRVPLGVDLHGLLRTELTPGQKRILSGSALSGHESQYLSRYHLQASVLDVVAPKKSHWFMAALRTASRPSALIPTQALEHTLGPDLPVAHLLRALSIGDVETAERLGCLGLAEEDLALATYVTGAEIDFGKRLRFVLDALESGT